MIALHKTPEAPIYKVGQSITFSSNISHKTFKITSVEMKNICSCSTGESVRYHLYGIKDAKKPSENDNINFFALVGTRSKFFGKTPGDAKRVMLKRLLDNRQI